MLFFRHLGSFADANRTWEFFQANKTFTLEAYRIVMGYSHKEAKKWLTAGERTGMVKHIGSNKYESTGSYDQEDGEPCPF